jgi:hypothetical protein
MTQFARAVIQETHPTIYARRTAYPECVRFVQNRASLRERQDDELALNPEQRAFIGKMTMRHGVKTFVIILLVAVLFVIIGVSTGSPPIAAGVVSGLTVFVVVMTISIRGRNSLRREIQSQSGKRQVRDHFFGGMMRGPMNWTQPLVRLNLSPNAVEMVPSVRLLGRLVPRWKATLNEISEVQAVKGMFGSYGLQFRTSGSERVVFWTSEQSQVCDSLQALGVQVLRNQIPVKEA